MSGAAGKNGDRLSVLLLEAENFKADGFADARDDGDILDFLAGDVVNGLLFRDFAFHAAEIDGKRHFGIAERGLCFEDFSGGGGFFKRRL